LEVIEVSTKDLIPNTYNPNKMSEDKYEILKENIRKGGMLQPILVSMDNVIIDGYHRWKACKELGIDKVWAVKVEDTEERAKLKTLAMNRIRGANNPILLGDLLKDLASHDEIDAEFIAQSTSLKLYEIEQLLRYTDLSDDFSFEGFMSEDDAVFRYGEILGTIRITKEQGLILKEGLQTVEDLGFELRAYEVIYLFLCLYLEGLKHDS
jgi:ParB/RepB/Spo0J family partition protein